jgi:hypothetical protein
MSVDLDAKAERLKLARLLTLDAEELAFLEHLPAEVLVPVRERVSDLLFSQGRARFDRLVAASRLLPNALAVAIAQRVFPPLVCAQVAGRLEADRVAGLVRHADIGFLADMAERTDPRIVAHLIPELPADVAVAAAREMMSRDDHLAAGRLVGLAPDRLIPDLVDAVDDEGDLLEIAFYLEHKDRLDPIVRHVPDARLERVLEIAHERDLWAEALLLASHLGTEQTRRLASVTVRAPRETITGLLEGVHRQGLWPQLLSLVEPVDDAELPPMASHPFLRQREVLVDVLAAAEHVEGWEVVVRVVAAMEAPEQDELVDRLPDLTAQQRRRMATAAERRDLLEAIGPARPVLEA